MASYSAHWWESSCCLNHQHGHTTTNAAATATAPYGCPLGCSGCKAQTGTADANMPSSNFLLMQLSKDKPQDEPAPGSYVNSTSSRYTYMMQKHDFVNSWVAVKHP